MSFKRSEDTETLSSKEQENTSQPIPDAIQYHDVGFSEYDKTPKKVILSDALRTKMIRLGMKYFQNSEGPFISTQNQSMNKR